MTAQPPTGGPSARCAPPTGARPPGPSSTTPTTRWPAPPMEATPTRCASSAAIGRARPQQERLGCAQPNGQVSGHPAGNRRMVVGAAGRRLPARHGRPQTVRRNECGAQGAVVRVPVVATRVGDVPAGVTLADPAQVVNASTTPAHPAPAVLGGTCSDVNKLAYDPTNNEQVVCEGNAGPRPPSRWGCTPSVVRATGRTPRCSRCPRRTTATCCSATRSPEPGPAPQRSPRNTCTRQAAAVAGRQVTGLLHSRLCSSYCV